MIDLAARTIWTRQYRRVTPACTDLLQPRRGTAGRVDDRVVRCPRRTARGTVDRSDGDWRSTRYRDFGQIGDIEIADPLAIERCKRVPRLAQTADRCRVETIKGPYEKFSRIPGAHIDNLRPVSRDGQV